MPPPEAKSDGLEAYDSDDRRQERAHGPRVLYCLMHRSVIGAPEYKISADPHVGGFGETGGGGSWFFY